MCFISLFYTTFSYTTVWIELMEKHVISCINKRCCHHDIILFSLESLLTTAMEIVFLFYFSVQESLSSSMVVGSLSYYLSSVLIFSITEIDANSNNFKKSTDSLSTVIGLPFHGRQNFRKFGCEIPAPRSPLTY
jgi:hypothetical protein